MQQNRQYLLNPTQVSTFGNKLPMSPSMRARNLRMRDPSAGSPSSSLSHNSSSSSLASFNSSARAANAQHFRAAGRDIIGQSSPATAAFKQRQAAAQQQQSSQGNGAFLSLSNANYRASDGSNKSFSSVGNHSQRSASTNSADLGQLYSSQSGTSSARGGGAGASSASSSSYRGASRGANRSILLMNLDSEGDSGRNGGAGVIRVEMQPKKQIRTQEVFPDQFQASCGPTTKVLLSHQSSSKVCDYTQISAARHTFISGSTASRTLEQTHLFSEGLLWREAESSESAEEPRESQLLDLDDDQGAEVCKTFLCSVERLMCSLTLPLVSRAYREDFTNSYKVLYKQMLDQFDSQAAYLPEILDSAQEAFDHLWVNGEKYVFSDHVVESGTALFTHFTELRRFISAFYQRHFELDDCATDDEDFADEFCLLRDLLVRFDELWTTYESKYVYELMVIEGDARRFIIESINVEAILGQNHMQLPAMAEQFNMNRAKLLENICQVNAVANQEGKGRDDFAFALLLQAESLQKVEMLKRYSKAVSKVAENIQSTYDGYRQLMKQYSENIELLDPQLKNNAPLVQVMTAFEDAWSLGQNQIGSPERLQQLDMFSRLLEKTCNEVAPFNELVECRDASIFMSIPALLILETLLDDSRQKLEQSTSAWTNLCSRFKADIAESEEFKQTVTAFSHLQEMKTLVSKLKLQVLEVGAPQSTEFQSETNQVKYLGMDLQRSQPMEWNEFMTACLATDE